MSGRRYPLLGTAGGQQLARNIQPGGGVEQKELGRAANGLVGEVSEPGLEAERVAGPQKARRVGRNLKLLLRDKLPG